MLQLTAQTRILVAVEPADFRCGIDGLAKRTREVLEHDPFSGCVFVFRNRRGTAVKVLAYDGQGFWLCHKRLSEGRFAHWPKRGATTATPLEAHELTVLLRGGDPSTAQAAPVWRAITVQPLGDGEQHHEGLSSN
jgi:transposase